MLLEYKDRHELPDEEAMALFDHIGRTGGGTLTAMLKSHFGEKLIRINAYQPTALYSNPQINHIACITGHGVHGIHGLLPKWRKAFYFTLLRHPFRRMVSQCRAFKLIYNSNETMDSLIYRKNENDFYVNWLGNGDLERAKATLFEQYAFFGITEFYGESAYGLSAFFPWLKGQTTPPKKASTPEYPISKLAEEYFLEKNAGDMELYENAVKEFKKRFPEQPEQSDMVIENTTKKFMDVSAKRRGHIFSKFYKSFPLAIGSDIGHDNLVYPDLFKINSFFHLVQYGRHKYNMVNIYGNAVFDILDEIDSRNQIGALVLLRLQMIQYFCRSHGGDRRSTCNMQLKEFSGRCRSWLLVLRANPEWRARALNAEVKLLEKDGEFDAALESARQAVAINPDNFEFHKILSGLLMKTGAVAEAENMARAELADNPDSEWALRQLGLALFVKNDRQEAKTILRKAWEKNPCWKDVQARLLDLLLAEGLLDEAETVARECLVHVPPWEGELHGFLARIFGVRGDWNAAIAKARQGLEHARKVCAPQPEMRSLAANLAHYLRLAGNENECEDFCRKAISEDPGQGWAWRELCRMADSQGDRARALEMGAKAIAVHPEDYEFRRYYDALVSGATSA